MSSTTAGSLSNSFRTGNTREVVAILTITRFIKPSFNESSGGNLLHLLGVSQEKTGLIVTRPWFGFDQVIFDSDLADKANTAFVAESEASKLYEELALNPAGAITTARQEHISDEDVFDAMSEVVPSFIQLKFSGMDHMEKIRMYIPFQKLQDFLLRAVSTLDARGIGVLEQVKVTHAPRFDNAGAAVARLLSYDS